MPPLAIPAVTVDRHTAVAVLARNHAEGGAQRPVEELKPGDRVLTRDHGGQPVRWIGTQTVRFTSIDHEARRATTSESGGSVRAWDHTMTVTEHDDGTCTYTDHVEIDAGPMTAAVAWFARRLYAHRHRHWRRLAPLLTSES